MGEGEGFGWGGGDVVCCFWEEECLGIGFSDYIDITDLDMDF